MTNELSPATKLVASLEQAIGSGKQVTTDQVFAYLDHQQIVRPDEQEKVLREALAACNNQDGSELSDTFTAACAVVSNCLEHVLESA